jgi:hypothetical protein
MAHFACVLYVIGLINPAVTGIIGPGVVVHLPSFFDEFDALRGQGAASSFCALLSLAKSQLTLYCFTVGKSTQDWTARADSSFPIARTSSLTFTRSSTG